VLWCLSGINGEINVYNITLLLAIFYNIVDIRHKVITLVL